MSRENGVGDDELIALADHRRSDLFSPLEKLVLDLAVAMTRLPVEVDDALRAALREHFTTAQLMELVSTISWENHRARINKTLDIQAAGFSDGAFCMLPHAVPPSDLGAVG